MHILVTGAAGFIGSALTAKLLAAGHTVVAIDAFTEYYDSRLKRARVATLLPGVTVRHIDITDASAVSELFSQEKFDVVCHLAALAGVRYSLEAPHEYVNTNIAGTLTLLEAMRQYHVSRIVFASTSSVYGDTTPVPFVETSSADKPVSIYAATKRAGEQLLYTYHHLYGIEATCLRFFTVYGPWSRPDMAMLKFAERMSQGETIDIYNHGNQERDFTYIDDIVAGFVSAVERPLGYEIINLGCGNPVQLMDFVNELERALGMVAEKRFLPAQPGDVPVTFADITKAHKLLDYTPTTPLFTGMGEFGAWFQAFWPSFIDR